MSRGGLFGDMVSETLFPRDAGRDLRLRGLNGRDWRQHAAHLQRLTAQDRRARFHSAVSDSAIRRYVRRLDWSHVYVFGVFVDGTLRAAGELIPMATPGQAEVSVSVEHDFQNSGFGKMLMLSLFLAARRLGLRQLHLICHPDNEGMRSLARDVGAKLRYSEGVIEGVITLPPLDDEGAGASGATDNALRRKIGRMETVLPPSDP